MNNEQLRKDLEDKKVEKYNLTEVKTLIDDGIRKLLNDGLGYAEHHKHMDTKLVFGFPAAAVAAGVAYYNHRVPFEECRWIIGAGVLAYFILNSSLMLYIWYVEGSTIYVGSKGSRRVEIKSVLKNYDPNYKLKLLVSDGKSKQKSTDKTVLVSNWIDVEGHLASDKFISDLTKFLE